MINDIKVMIIKIQKSNTINRICNYKGSKVFNFYFRSDYIITGNTYHLLFFFLWDLARLIWLFLLFRCFLRLLNYYKNELHWLKFVLAPWGNIFICNVLNLVLNIRGRTTQREHFLLRVNIYFVIGDLTAH